jgi:hypothetical protein
VILGIVLTIVAELWAVAAGVEAVKQAFSGGSNGPDQPSTPSSSTPQANLARCGSKSLGFEEEERDPDLKKACDEERQRVRQQEFVEKCVAEYVKANLGSD